MTSSPAFEDHTSVSEALKKVGLQVTAQRMAVYRAVHDTPHAMAEEVHCTVRSKIGAISRQAVYDALNVMFERGLIRRIQPAGSGARYEHRVDNHHHLVCRNCDSLVDIDCATGKAPCLQADNDHGFLIDEAEVIYWGICPKCQIAPNPN
ncbi:MAG: Fur family transcriptional regulator [Granulosicoccus sp.]